MSNLLDEFKGRGVIWVLHRASLAEQFEKVLVVRAGRVVGQGAFDDLNADGGALKELIDAE
jgi:ABC-type multidrug transport system fused ATPase/permease subunit